MKSFDQTHNPSIVRPENSNMFDYLFPVLEVWNSITFTLYFIHTQVTFTFYYYYNRNNTII